MTRRRGPREHGTRGKYSRDGCRCTPCTIAAARYRRKSRAHDRSNPCGLPSLPPDSGWMDDAACKGADMEAFFPTRGEAEVFVVAFAICEDCPVKADCLEFALEHRLDGIWGGTSGRARAKMLRDGRSVA